MSELNVINKELALKNFFLEYASFEDLQSKTKIGLLEWLGDYEEGDKESPDSYTPNDVFIGVASSATGIPERDFLIYALKHFKHDMV